jgi:hypothetical protein
MSKRIVLGVLLAVVASAVTAGVVVVVGQGGGQGDDVKIPPSKAVEEWTPYTLPGTPVAGLALPIDHGRFHILPPGSAPDVYAPGPAVPPGLTTARVDVRNSQTLDEFRDHDLFIEPPYIPAGWKLARAHAETVIWSDGSRTDSAFGLEYERPQYFYIRIQRFLLAPDAQVELIGDGPSSEDQEAYTLGGIRGVPVVFNHQAPGQHIQAFLQVHFVTDNVVTVIEGVAIDFDELIKIADGLIGQMQEASP